MSYDFGGQTIFKVAQLRIRRKIGKGQYCHAQAAGGSRLPEAAQDLRGACIPTSQQFGFKCVNRAEARVDMTVNGQFFGSLPALDGADGPSEKYGDFLPRIKTLGNYGRADLLPRPAAGNSQRRG